MIFPSEEFLFLFLPITIVIYYALLRKTKIVKNIFLFGASLFFYSWGADDFVYLMLLVIFQNWTYGMVISQNRENVIVSRIIIAIMIISNVGILGWYKYSNFLVDNMNTAFGLSLEKPNVILPIGISFFIFQAISYVIDVYRGDGEVQYNPLDVGLYIAFFPQLIAGPIVRYETIAQQIKNRVETFDDYSNGVCRFVIGLGKKVIIANNVAIVADAAFELVHTDGYHASFIMAWLGAIAYTLQIFFDFAGYSDMAIGLGKMFGFHFEENFNYPYMSRSITQFWRRWHISLGTWFKDYVYFPLGGSRVKTKSRLVFNLFVVWMLTGIWHGDNWTFIAWGFLYFLLLTLEKLFELPKKIGLFGHFYTLFFVIIGWVIFRSDNLSEAFVYLKAMAGIGVTSFIDSGAIAFMKQNSIYFIIGIFSCIPIVKVLDNQLKEKFSWNIIYTSGLVTILLAAIALIFSNSYNPFIYYNF